MNTTVAILVPEWAVWLFVLLAVISMVESASKIYVHYLTAKLEKQRAAAEIGKSGYAASGHGGGT